MSDKTELKQRKTKESKDNTKNDLKNETKSQPKNETKNQPKNPPIKPISAAEIKRLTEEHHSEISKKIFRRSVKRIGLISVALIVIYVYNRIKTDQSFTPFVTVNDEILDVPFVKQLPCSDDYELDRQNFAKCAPKICGRIVIDNLINERESTILLSLFKKALMLNPLSSNGSASILDLHSGALSYEKKFVNVYALLKNEKKQQYFTQAEFSVYRQVKDKIHNFIAKQFMIPKESLYLTSPTFFSKLTSLPPQSIHDEYWHQHIDKKTYKSFHYTSLLYLNTYYNQFSGGRFVFTDQTANYTVEPKQSRVLAFTSGSENPHFVEKVDRGVRYAITISFTCDSQLAIEDPKLLN